MPKIDRKLVTQLKGAGERIEAAVVLRTVQTPPATLSRAEARSALARSVKPVQDPVVHLVRSRGDQVLNTFWLKNMVLVRAAPATIEALAQLETVERIIPNFTLSAPEPEKAATTASAAATTWGISKIGADKVQGDGVTGKGVRVAILDTGIDITHPDLAGKLVTADSSDSKHPGGWIEFSPEGNPIASEPHDSSYHGTHVAGTIAGGNASGTQIGVAPGSELMAGLVIPDGSGTLAQVIAGMQWALAPFAADGTPAGEPADVVSMSLGATGYSDELIEPTRNIYYAGAFPAFAIGNDCAAEESSSPGNVYEAVAVGATDASDDVPEFSCGGVVERTDWFDAPAEWPDSYVVPDVSAPGVDVVSSMPGGAYGTLSGTSMATPHVAGTAALMLQARPDLTVEGALEILLGTSVSDDRYGPRPNPRVGAGRIDAYAAVSEAALKSGVHGVVTDRRTRQPLAGVKLTRADGRSVETGADGRFELRLPAGEHQLTLTRFGYDRATTTVSVLTGRLTDARIQLEPTRRGTISGRVVYEPTGLTVPGATVTVLDVPDTLVATTDKNGRYTLKDVPYGDYRIVAHAPGVSRSEPVAVHVASGKPSADLALTRRAATERVSLGSDGRQGNGPTWWPDVSGDGSVVVYASFATNLADDEDTNGELDVFATDLRTRVTERVSVASDGGQADAFSLSPTVSRDGRFVAFNSGATNLVPGDTNGQTDAFVHDRQTGSTERISVASDGTQGDGLSGSPKLSADGRFAVFTSDATNLVPGDTNGRSDVFVRDRQTGTTERLSVAADGSQAEGDSREATISDDGRYVAFESQAATLVPGDGNGVIDVFVRDRRSGTITLVAGPHPETETRAAVISAAGRSVAFTNGVGLGQLYVQDLATGVTELVTATVDGAEADGMSFAPSLSADGRMVAFYSSSDQLVEGDKSGWFDVFVRDVVAGKTERVSAAPKGVDGDGWADLPSISDDGRYVAFESNSENLVDGDTNRQFDVFVHDRAAGPEALFVLSDLQISPEISKSGHVRIRAEVKNVGERTGEYHAMLRVNGLLEQQRKVLVRPGKSTGLSFDVRRSDVGAYAVVLGPLSGRFTVKH